MFDKKNDDSVVNNTQTNDIEDVATIKEVLNTEAKDMKRYNFFYQPLENCKMSIWKQIWSFKKNIFMMFVASLFFNFGIIVFLNRGETIPTGLMGIAALANVFFKGSLAKYMALIFWGLNVPLLIIYWRKIKRTFIVLTLLFMVFQSVVNLILTIDPILNFFETYINIQPGWSLESHTNWPIFVYGTIGALFVAVGISLSWKYGGSTGGTDIIVYYFSTKSKKDVNRVMAFFSIGLTVVFLLSFFLIKKFYLRQNLPLISASSISTVIYIIIIDVVVERIYPKYKKVKLTIYTDNPQDVVAYLDYIGYWHSYIISDGISGYTKNNKYVVETVVLLLEAKHLIKDLKKFAPHLWFSITPIRIIEGAFNTFKVD